ncbi:MAG: type II toxin-antitoxin system RelE/ParE family toxin [Candidatus Aminicenantes bacterium]|nr:type II toxin-antitoxin system RelE/ParE family toxin [Candidatus Aminicenantes bacterium]
MNIRWLEKAVVDLEEAYEFILFDNPPAAAGEVDKVLRAVERLAENSAMGRPGRVPKTRELVVPGTPYIVIYRVKNDRLEILRVFHGARQWPQRRRK